MIVTLNWLKEFVDLPITVTDNNSVIDLVEVFNSLGLVVEKYSYYGVGIDSILICKVLNIAPIKDADKIRLATVELAEQKPAEQKPAEQKTVEVVCGAWNFNIGDFVPYAPIGSALPNGLEIKERKMRGQVSCGMLCSATEIGLFSDQNGLMLLDVTDQDIGRSIVEVLNITPDIIFNIETEGNRPDALSVIGIARDLAAKYRIPFKDNLPLDGELTVENLNETLSSKANFDEISVVIEDPDMCKAFGMVEISNVKVGPSNFLIQQRLLASNMRPLNNVVDISNYLMLERGQPSHPYNMDLINDRMIRVRIASEGETIETLDSKSRLLGKQVPGISSDTGDLVISDGRNAIGIAGIMGGSSTEIDDKTENIVLEVANFNPIAIARTSKRLGLSSEASKRFERGVDPLGIDASIVRYVRLLEKNSSSDICVKSSGILRSTAFEKVKVMLRPKRIKEILGIELTCKEVKDLIEPLGFKVKLDVSETNSTERVDIDNVSADILDVEIPSFRPDSEREIDIIEEIARVYGYETIPKVFVRPPEIGYNFDLNKLIKQIKYFMVSQNFYECWTPTFLPIGIQEKVNIFGKEIRLSRPLAKEEAVLRMSLAPGLAKVAEHNDKRKFTNINLFEVGHVFKDYKEETPPVELVKLGAISYKNQNSLENVVEAIYGIVNMLKLKDVEIVNSWEYNPDSQTEFDSTYDFEPELQNHTWMPFSLSRFTSEELLNTSKTFKSGTAAYILSSGKPLGLFGQLSNKYDDVFGISTEACGYFELDLLELLNADRKIIRVSNSKYPDTEFDLAFIVDSSVNALTLKDEIESVLEGYISYVWLFDVYRGVPLASNEKSLAFKIRASNPSSTLSEEEISNLRNKIIQEVSVSLDARLR